MNNILAVIISDPIYYVISGFLAVFVLFGIFLMSKVEKAKLGNLISGFAVLSGVVVSLIKYNVLPIWIIYLAIFIGAIFGLIITFKTKMIQMPQLIALLNSLGGLASAIVGAYALLGIATDLTVFSTSTAMIALIIGGLTFAGSIIAAAKLHNIIRQRPITLKGHHVWTISLFFLALVVVVLHFLLVLNPIITLVLLTVLSLSFGILFTLHIGGADMPIVISLLNSLSGVAGAISGLAISDILLVSIGGIVGASGLLLTQIMCRAMNRRLLDILFAKPAAKVTPQVEPETTLTAGELSTHEKADYQAIFNAAKEVIIVPGYGMAVAQAQHLVKETADLLKENGSRVRFAIHPVAGRMPGHMNVLLAEVDIDYDELFEMDDLNEDFINTDLVIVVGANDVINPAAKTDVGTPLYGMPILNVEQAKEVFIFNFDLKPGYSGVPNPLYKKEQGVHLFLGDAADTLKNFLSELKKDIT